jgi:hemerythrin-like domain-containing protein
MEPGSYETDTSGMARAHGHVEVALEAAPRYVRRAADSRRVAAVASFCENLLEYVHVHHGAEDELLYPRLEQRCPASVASVKRIGTQHQLLEEPMAAARGAIDRWRTDPTGASTTALCDALGSVLQALTPHCREEEATIVPLASRYLSQAEWEEMRPHEARSYRADKPWLMLGLAMERSDEAHRAALLAPMPEARRTLWINEWSPAFDQFMAQVRA